MSNDPWKHRQKNMRCTTCMYFVVKAKPQGEVADTLAETGVTGQLGRCRRHAPTMKGFPAVFELDWCGDHKLDETKI